MRPIGSPEELLHHRQRAIALLKQGLDKNEMARRIGVNTRTVGRWHRAYRRGGEAMPWRPNRLPALRRA
jgi:transposase